MTMLTVIGNLTAAPEMRFTPGGQALCKFTVAATERYKDKDGQWKDREDTLFQRCTVWGKTAEHAAASLAKGDRVIVYGRLSQRPYEAPDGSKRSSVELVVEEVGPSVKFSEVTIKKTERTAGAGAQSDPWATPTESAWDKPPF